MAITLDCPACGHSCSVPQTYADIAAAAHDFGFQPRTTIDEGLPKFVAWYRGYHGV